MNIKELSIGDWVRHTFYEENVRIARIDGDSERVLAERGKLSISCHLNHFEPIPLTPEILEKNGFTRLEPSVNYDWWCLDDKDKFLVGFGFGKEEGRTATGWVFDTVGSCDYKRPIGVHELQNLLRLTGIEKEIELC